MFCSGAATGWPTNTVHAKLDVELSSACWCSETTILCRLTSDPHIKLTSWLFTCTTNLHCLVFSFSKKNTNKCHSEQEPELIFFQTVDLPRKLTATCFHCVDGSTLTKLMKVIEPTHFFDLRESKALEDMDRTMSLQISVSYHKLLIRQNISYYQPLIDVSPGDRNTFWKSCCWNVQLYQPCFQVLMEHMRTELVPLSLMNFSKCHLHACILRLAIRKGRVLELIHQMMLYSALTNKNRETWNTLLLPSQIKEVTTLNMSSDSTQAEKSEKVTPQNPFKKLLPLSTSLNFTTPTILQLISRFHVHFCLNWRRSTVSRYIFPKLTKES